MHNHCINKLLNLKGVIVKKIIHADSFVKIMLETNPKEQICPACGKSTKKIHDYRMQTIKDLPFQLKHCYLILHKRRYVCSCGKRFYEDYEFLPRYFHRTTRLTAFIASALHENRPLSSIAQMYNVSTATVNRILDTIFFDVPKIPSVLAIDEFKGNAGGQKYQCILVVPVRHSVLDISCHPVLRPVYPLISAHFLKERYQVKFFVCDIWRPYTELAAAFFPNASIMIDKYHFIRQVTLAIEKVRKRLQKTMPLSLRKYYKRSRSLILARYEALKEEKKACDLMLLYNDYLRLAHSLKEWFYRICQNSRYSEPRRDFGEWIRNAKQSQIPEFETCAATYRNWSMEILNAFKY